MSTPQYVFVELAEVLLMSTPQYMFLWRRRILRGYSLLSGTMFVFLEVYHHCQQAFSHVMMMSGCNSGN